MRNMIHADAAAIAWLNWIKNYHDWLFHFRFRDSFFVAIFKLNEEKNDLDKQRLNYLNFVHTSNSRL